MSTYDHPSLDIDYPSQDETVSSGHYTFRLSATTTLIEAEISIDRGPWLSCRHACGMWWFDWDDGLAGSHQMVARGTAQDGRTLNSTLRRFVVANRR